MLKRAIQLSGDVQQALLHKRAIVALESTIIAHGMPFPQNLEMAREVEEIIRKHDAVPATVAIMSGQIHVGLTADQLNHLAAIGPKAHHGIFDRQCTRDACFLDWYRDKAGFRVNGVVLARS